MKRMQGYLTAAALLFFLAAPIQADVTAEGAANFQKLFGERGFTLDNPPSYQDLEAAGWSRARIEHADLLVDNPPAAEAYESFFSEQFGALGFTLDSPPTEADLLSLNFSSGQISAISDRLDEIRDGEEKRGLVIQHPTPPNTYNAYAQPGCVGPLGQVSLTLLQLWCGSGYAQSYQIAGQPACHPCSSILLP